MNFRIVKLPFNGNLLAEEKVFSFSEHYSIIVKGEKNKYFSKTDYFYDLPDPIIIFEKLGVNYSYYKSSVIYGVGSRIMPRTLNKVCFLTDQKIVYNKNFFEFYYDKKEMNYLKNFKNPKEYYVYRIIKNKYSSLLRNVEDPIELLFNLWISLKEEDRILSNFFLMELEKIDEFKYSLILDFEKIFIKNSSKIKNSDNNFIQKILNFGINYKSIGLLDG